MGKFNIYNHTLDNCTQLLTKIKKKLIKIWVLQTNKIIKIYICKYWTVISYQIKIQKHNLYCMIVSKINCLLGKTVGLVTI